MKITVDGQQYEFDQDRFMLSEARAIEKVCGVTFKEWGDLLSGGSMEALAALVWIVQKRENPELRFSDVDFPVGSVTVEDESEDPPVPSEVTTA